jgi:ribosomal protein L4
MGSHAPSSLISDLHTGHRSWRLERSQSVTHDCMQSWCASRVQGHGSTHEDGSSEGSWSVRQMKHRRGASGARAGCTGSAAGDVIVGGGCAVSAFVWDGGRVLSGSTVGFCAKEE